MLTFKRLLELSEELSTMYLDEYFSVIWKVVTVNFIDKKHFLTLYCLITWNQNHASMVIQY